MTQAPSRPQLLSSHSQTLIYRVHYARLGGPPYRVILPIQYGITGIIFGSYYIPMLPLLQGGGRVRLNAISKNHKHVKYTSTWLLRVSHHQVQQKYILRSYVGANSSRHRKSKVRCRTTGKENHCCTRF